MKRICIQVTNKNRWGELGCLLTGLLNQTYNAWDIVILDENDTSLDQCEFIQKLLNLIRLKNHGVQVIKNTLKIGVCNARNKLLEESNYNNIDYVARIDDDVIPEPDYLEKLVEVIELGYDIASGVTPLAFTPSPIRKTEWFDSPIINRKDINEKGEITYYGDDCGVLYDKEVIIEAHEFRSSCLMKLEVAKKIRYPTNLSPVGFREEFFFSFKAMKEGYKIGVNTSAIIWHLQTSSGGCRHPNYAELVKSDNEYFYKWVRENYANN